MEKEEMQMQFHHSCLHFIKKQIWCIIRSLKEIKGLFLSYASDILPRVWETREKVKEWLKFSMIFAPNMSFHPQLRLAFIC